MKRSFKQISKIAQKLDGYYEHHAEPLDIVQFYQLWLSTALGFDEWGGQKPTYALTTVVVHQNLSADVWFDGRLAYQIKKISDKFIEDMNNRHMKSVKNCSVYMKAKEEQK